MAIESRVGSLDSVPHVLLRLSLYVRVHIFRVCERFRVRKSEKRSRLVVQRFSC